MTVEDARGRFAVQLRASIDDFLSLTHTDDELDRATDLLIEARAHLAGPPAPHYYDRVAGGDHDPLASFLEYLNQTPFGGGHNPVSPPGTIQLTDDPERPGVIGTVTAGRPFEGPAKCLHGGTVAGLFDHFLGMAQHAYNRVRGTSIVAATKELTIRYVAPTPLDTQLTFRTWVEEVDERRVRGYGTCHAGEVLTASAEGDFIKLDVNRILSTDAGGFARP
jgi:acyl-coenzyme A thioesterase PaaI-like protein